MATVNRYIVSAVIAMLLAGFSFAQVVSIDEEAIVLVSGSFIGMATSRA
ncbi:MAG: hypothetical protein MZV65_31055 [Chromatiales bacterium]|nr:hypothetical protein [Chromatiales bacterium]